MMALVKELELARQRVLALEQKVGIERQADEARLDVLASLPSLYGFTNVEAFERAVREAAGEVLPASSTVQPRTLNPVLGGNGAVTYAVPSPPLTAQGIQASRVAQEKTAASPSKGAVVERPAEAPVAAAPVAIAPAPPKPLPTGTSLADPTNFGQLPDETLLERGAQYETVFRSRLNTAQIFAQQVLHTSKVPAAVWRAWRDFSKKAADALRAPIAS